MTGSWTIYVVTDTGRKVPHWTEDNRRDALAMLRGFRRAFPATRFALAITIYP